MIRSFRPTPALSRGSAGIHNPESWLWIPGSRRSLSSGRPERAGPVGRAPE
jgi:hypothetical protein